MKDWKILLMATILALVNSASALTRCEVRTLELGIGLKAGRFILYRQYTSEAYVQLDRPPLVFELGIDSYHRSLFCSAKQKIQSPIHFITFSFGPGIFIRGIMDHPLYLGSGFDFILYPKIRLTTELKLYPSSIFLPFFSTSLLYVGITYSLIKIP